MNNACETLPTLGVVIVNYCSAALTERCVQSLLEHRIAAATDIVVVDNLSPDGSGQQLQRSLPEGVRVLLSTHNRGYAS
ncbi:MAG: hypothetical protein RI907_464, partial [Pseudomonadota bacterium]